MTDDAVIVGTARPKGTTGMNIGRAAALRAGLPASTAGVTRGSSGPLGILRIRRTAAIQS
jgi:acetyl-CoA C-acetyltransferase